MPVNIIDTLKPKNNGTFPVVEAVDVAVTSTVRLPEALAAKADATDLAATDAAVAAKANADDVVASTANLQAQINQIITPVTQDAEVQNARVDSNGESHTTLKERLDYEADIMKGRITDVASDLASVVSGGEHDPSTNYIDFSTLLADSFIKGGDHGQPASSATSVGMYATDFIKLEENTDYYLGNVARNNCAFYDADKNYISGYGSGESISNPFQIPQGAVYGRFTIVDLSASGNNWIYTENDRPADYAETVRTLAPDIVIPEVLAAREESDTLKDRLDSDFETLDSKIDTETGILSASISAVDEKIDSIVTGGGHDPSTNYVNFDTLVADSYILGADQGQIGLRILSGACGRGQAATT